MKETSKIAFLAIIMSLISCSKINRSIKREKIINEYVANNFYLYENIYDELNREIEKHIKKRSKRFSGQLLEEFRVDKLILFNDDKSRLFTTINTLTTKGKGNSDWVKGLYGIKIKGAWHLYPHGYLVGLRAPYKYNIKIPFSWDQISFVAHENFFMRFLTFKNGKLVIDNKSVDESLNLRNLCGSDYINEETEEKGFEKCSTEFKRYTELELNERMDRYINADLLPVSEPPRLTKWDKLLGRKDPIFETKEWKEYIKSKNSPE